MADDVEHKRGPRAPGLDEATLTMAELMRAQAEARLEVVRLEQSRLDALGGTNVLRWLASPYAKHQDYRAEWRPDTFG